MPNGPKGQGLSGYFVGHCCGQRTSKNGRSAMSLCMLTLTREDLYSGEARGSVDVKSDPFNELVCEPGTDTTRRNCDSDKV